MAAEQLEEQRRFHRVLFDNPCYLKDASSSWRCAVIDLSLNGALVCSPDDWKDQFEGELKLEIPLEDGLSAIEMDVVIAHSDQGRLGLQRVAIDTESIAHLKRLVELNLGDMSLLERDLVSLVVV